MQSTASNQAPICNQKHQKHQITTSKSIFPHLFYGANIALSHTHTYLKNYQSQIRNNHNTHNMKQYHSLFIFSFAQFTPFITHYALPFWSITTHYPNTKHTATKHKQLHSSIHTYLLTYLFPHSDNQPK